MQTRIASGAFNQPSMKLPYLSTIVICNQKNCPLQISFDFKSRNIFVGEYSEAFHLFNADKNSKCCFQPANNEAARFVKHCHLQQNIFIISNLDKNAKHLMQPPLHHQSLWINSAVALSEASLNNPLGAPHTTLTVGQDQSGERGQKVEKKGFGMVPIPHTLEARRGWHMEAPFLSLDWSWLVSAEKSQAVWLSMNRCLRLQNCVTEVLCPKRGYQPQPSAWKEAETPRSLLQCTSIYPTPQPDTTTGHN